MTETNDLTCKKCGYTGPSEDFTRNRYGPMRICRTCIKADLKKGKQIHIENLKKNKAEEKIRRSLAAKKAWEKRHMKQAQSLPPGCGQILRVETPDPEPENPGGPPDKEALQSELFTEAAHAQSLPDTRSVRQVSAVEAKTWQCFKCKRIWAPAVLGCIYCNLM